MNEITKISTYNSFIYHIMIQNDLSYRVFDIKKFIEFYQREIYFVLNLLYEKL
jgi:hypothetical protein